jgi:hypothetical protein
MTGDIMYFDVAPPFDPRPPAPFPFELPFEPLLLEPPPVWRTDWSPSKSSNIVLPAVVRVNW